MIWNVPQILGQRVYSCNSGLSAEGTPQIQVEPTKIPPVTLWLSFLTVLKAKIPFRTERRRTPVLQDEQLAQGQERIRGYVCEAVCRMHLALSRYIQGIFLRQEAAKRSASVGGYGRGRTTFWATAALCRRGRGRFRHFPAPGSPNSSRWRSRAEHRSTRPHLR